MTYDEIVDFWKSNTFNSLECYRQILGSLPMSFTYYSSLLDAYPTSRRTVLEVFTNSTLTSTGAKPSDVILLHNQKMAWDYMLQSVLKNKILNSYEVKRLHARLMEDSYSDVLLNRGETPGEYRLFELETYEEYMPSTPQRIHSDMLALYDAVRMHTNGDAVIRAVCLYLGVLSVQPFAAGNGLLGRLLLNYVLLENNHPPVVISDTVSHDRALEYFLCNDDITPMVDLIKDQIVQSCAM